MEVVAGRCLHMLRLSSLLRRCGMLQNTARLCTIGDRNHQAFGTNNTFHNHLLEQYKKPLSLLKCSISHPHYKSSFCKLNPSSFQTTINTSSLRYLHSTTGHESRGVSDRICGVCRDSTGQVAAVRTVAVSPRALVEGCPKHVQPYLRLLRLDRPIGTWLLYVPCLWSLALASGSCLPDPYLLSLFGAGAVLMRGSGCVINDMWDKDFDAKVARTKTRPLACGEVTQFQALCLLGTTLSMSLAILLQFNWYSVFLGASAMGLVVTYPLMKRITYWPQLFLGLTLNWGVLLSWSVTTGSLPLVGLALYTAGVLHTIIYDTIYSHQDKEDDILIGVKSSALRLGEQTKPALAGFSAAMVTCLAATGVVLEQTLPYYLGVGYVAGHLARQIYTVNLNDPDDCFRKFCSNRNMGLVFWAFILAGNYMKSGDEEDNDKENDSNTDT